MRLVCPTFPTCLNSPGIGSEPTWDHGNGFYHTTTGAIPIGPVLPPIIWHFNHTTLAGIENFCSDHIMTWSIHRLCCFSCSLTSHCGLSDPTNIRRVAIKNLWILFIIYPYFLATPWVSVTSPYQMLEVKLFVKLHNLHIYHVVIRSEFRYLLAAKLQPKLNKR